MSDHDAHLVAMSILEAATALGLSTEAVRKRVRRGHLDVRTGNDGRKLVLVPRSELEGAEGPDQVRTNGEAVSVLRAEIDRLVSERDRARQDAEDWRAKAEAARLDAVRSEAGLVAAKGASAREREIAADLQRELAFARRPWWRRLTG